MKLTKAAFFLIVIISIYLIIFSLKEWQAENLYPIEKSILKKSLLKKLPTEQSVKGLKNAIELSSGSHTYHLLLGKYYAFRIAPGKKNIKARKIFFKKAENEFKKVISLNPTYTESLAYLAWIDFSLGRINKGFVKLEKALKLSPGNYINHIFYGICIINFINKIHKSLHNIYLYRAEQEIKKAIKINPLLEKNISVIDNLSKLYLIKGNLTLAIKQLEKIRKINKRTFPYHLKLATLYLRNKNGQKGINKYFSLINIIQGKKKKNNKNVSLSLDASSRNSYKNYILSLLMRDVKKYPIGIKSRFVLTKIFYASKINKEALKHLNFILRKKPDFAAAYYLRGEISESLGKFNSAYRDYETTLKYNRNHKKASLKIHEMIKKMLR